MLDFVVGMLRHADVDSGKVRVGLATYSSEPRVHFQLNKFKTRAAVEEAIGQVAYVTGSTNTADALRTLRETMFSSRHGDRNRAPNVAMVVTDGVSNVNADQTIEEGQLVHAAGIHVFVVGVGLTDTVEQESIASPPGRENLFLVRTFDELTQRDIRETTFERMCSCELICSRM